jgi:hypothetical protein
MATPVGPVPRDPDDPDLWTEWYDDDEGFDGSDLGPGRYGWPVRLIAAIAILGVILLFVL